MPGVEFFGCTGPRLRAAGVRTVVDAASLAVVGLIEVVGHIPRITVNSVSCCGRPRRRAELALLTDSPDFHLRWHGSCTAGYPVVTWWRPRRGRGARAGAGNAAHDPPPAVHFPSRGVFPVGVPATYIGHPLAAGASGFDATSF